jgi:hypothetical protein
MKKWIHKLGAFIGNFNNAGASASRSRSAKVRRQPPKRAPRPAPAGTPVHVTGQVPPQAARQALDREISARLKELEGYVGAHERSVPGLGLTRMLRHTLGLDR